MIDKEVLIKEVVTEQLENIDGILSTLEKKGKREGSELLLLFYFFSPEENKLKMLESRLLNLGFTEEDLYEDEGEFSLDIEYETKFKKKAIIDIITTVSTLCVELDVEFDGWEAEV
ncbi:ribonuclease E inhibitor RraB [Chitinophaga sp. 22536]|uniref:ribonuclease E inhibitor RraB n=1 Tax=unclassified Chitinophaga TaxID=2619133 RepID=UPI003F84998B